MKIIKIGALWCPECLIMRPRWQAIEKEFPGFNIEDFDVDQKPAVKAEYRVEHIPTYIFLDHGGNEILRLKGLIEKEDLSARILELKDR